MKLFHSLLVFLGWFTTPVVAPTPTGGGSYTTTETVILAGDESSSDRWNSYDSTRQQKYHANRCKVTLQPDGNLVVKRLVAVYPEYQSYKNAWDSGAGPAIDNEYYMDLNTTDGSLEIKRTGTNELVYTNNIGEPQHLSDLVTKPPLEFELRITEECVLNAYRGDLLVWTNNKWYGLNGYQPGIGDSLQRREMFRVPIEYNCGPTSKSLYENNVLLLQGDCNLVHFFGSDQADREGPVIWASNTARSDGADCYLIQEIDKVTLYKGTLDKTIDQFDSRAPDTVLWEFPFTSYEVPAPEFGYEVLLEKTGGIRVKP